MHHSPKTEADRSSISASPQELWLVSPLAGTTDSLNDECSRWLEPQHSVFKA